MDSACYDHTLLSWLRQERIGFVPEYKAIFESAELQPDRYLVLRWKTSNWP